MLSSPAPPFILSMLQYRPVTDSSTFSLNLYFTPYLALMSSFFHTFFKVYETFLPSLKMCFNYASILPYELRSSPSYQKQSYSFILFPFNCPLDTPSSPDFDTIKTCFLHIYIQLSFPDTTSISFTIVYKQFPKSALRTATFTSS